jgi:ATP-dependent Clp protease ATP-binding subunit ClpC
MWQRFTERARKIVFYAQEEAGRLGENYVSTEHLLLGLTRVDDSVAARILDRLGVSLERVRKEIERQITRGDGRLGRDMQLTPRAKRVIDLAYDEARQLNNAYIGTEHLLLGLIREEDGLAGRVLSKLGVSLEQARQEIRSLQEGGDNPHQPRPSTYQPRQFAPEGFPDDIAKRFVPPELYNAVLSLREVNRKLRDLPNTKQYDRAYELQQRRNDFEETIMRLLIEYDQKQKDDTTEED